MPVKTPSALYFVVYNPADQVFGYTWRAGTGGTSFYIKCRAKEIGGLKMSLHGPDPRSDISKPGFKLAIDPSALPKAHAAGGVIIGDLPDRGEWFTGRAIGSKARHVMTFRSTSDLFLPGVPSAPNPGRFNEDRERGLRIPCPTGLNTADIDIFVSDGAPYWWNTIQAFKDDSCLGPIRNKAGQYLTGQSIRRRFATSPAPVPKPTSSDDRIRGLVTSINSQGVLLVQEHWISRSFLAERAEPGRL
jgi:hypothetical protein